MLGEKSKSCRKALAAMREVCIEAGNVTDVVCNAARDHNADLVVIGRGRLHDTFGQTADECVLHHSRIGVPCSQCLTYGNSSLV